MGSFEAAGDFEDVVLELVRPAIREVSDEIAGNCEANIGFPGGRSGPVEVTDTARGCTVAMTGPFAHLEEWGSVNSSPTAPLRRAVEASGLEFEEI
ncbi:MAG TPA: hypothetical protein PK912_09290 [Microthrixaceae bacterium]|nr:hypothetical protein [Microthrixaceae bacterium]